MNRYAFAAGRSPGCLRAALLLAALLVFVPPAVAQRGALTIPQNLAEMTDEAQVILRGRVVNTRVEPHPQFENLQTVVVTLQVDAALKGQVGTTYTFRQFIWDIRDKHAAAGYKKAQNVLLLVTCPSRYGLCSTVGEEQGRFRIVRQPDGTLAAANGADNAGLFERMPQKLAQRKITLAPELASLVETHRAGPIRLQDLESMIRSLVGPQ